MVAPLVRAAAKGDGEHLARPVAASALVVDTSDLLEILLVLPGPLRGQLGVAGNGGMTVKGRRGDRQNTADRLDPIDLAMLFNESVRAGPRTGGGRRPSLAERAVELRPDKICVRPLSSDQWRKMVSPFFRISLAVRNSLTSRSSSLIRAVSSLLGPLRSPASRAA